VTNIKKTLIKIPVMCNRIIYLTRHIICVRLVFVRAATTGGRI